MLDRGAADEPSQRSGRRSRAPDGGTARGIPASCPWSGRVPPCASARARGAG